MFGLFGNTVPRSAANFAELCAGETVSQNTGRRLTYEGSKFYKVIRGFMAQGGDITFGDGTGGESIFGQPIIAENYQLSHDRKNLLSMANDVPGCNCYTS